MMQFLTDFLVALFTGYLAFTSSLADRIIDWLPSEQSTVAYVEETSVSNLPSLPSLFGGRLLPDILLRSAAYQQAAVAGAVQVNTPVTDPYAAIVNIFCTFTTPTTIRTTTGTGFFVHSDGVIITNAHVAQYLLLESTTLLGNADCVVRSGNPAAPLYRAELLYIPPAWVQTNAALIDVAVPTGTGERDYALLYVSESLTRSPLPARFPALAINSELVPRSLTGSAVKVAGFPAADLARTGANTPLLPRVADSTISELYTFGSNFADVFSIKGSSVGAQGSSGGPIVDETGKAIGVIVTRGNDEVDGVGSLRAITFSHIDRTIREETGFSLERNLTGNLPFRSQVFKETLAPFLIALLQTELSN